MSREKENTILPNLPGYSVHVPLSLTGKRFNRAQTLKYLNGYKVEYPTSLAIENQYIPKQTQAYEDLENKGDYYNQYRQQYDTHANQLNISRNKDTSTDKYFNVPTKLPKWVELDKQVLRFYCYTKEDVQESNQENYRVRKMVIYYYLEDDTINIDEPKEDNSGITQGKFIKRQKFFKDDGSLFKPNDFTIGKNINLCGKNFTVVDCDTWTRNQLEKDGVQVGKALPYPQQPIDEYRERFKNKAKGFPNSRTDDLTRYIEKKLGKSTNVLEEDKLAQFLKNYHKVLRFWCFWDNRDALCGDRRPYVLHYFLEDDTIELLEINELNSGRDPFPVFLKRSLVPKIFNGLRSFSVSQVHKDQCYNPSDLRIGSSISIYNRIFVIYRCDDFTKSWYQDKMGFSEEELEPFDIFEEVPQRVQGNIPEYNGYGTMEDSLQNCLHLIPKPPRKDLKKLINKDRMTLRFMCAFAASNDFQVLENDNDRRFILSYFMSDDTISLFEPPMKNTGITGGKFLERSKLFKEGTKDQYTFKDLYVGSIIKIYGRYFELLQADEYTYTYMDNNRHLFIIADLEQIQKALLPQMDGKEKALREGLIKSDPDGKGQISQDILYNALQYAKVLVTKHQCYQIVRNLDVELKGFIYTEPLLKFFRFNTS